MNKKLLVILGPTGVGKTDLSIKLAQFFNTSIISADSRQLYKGLEIGTAAPSEANLKTVKHYFVGELNIPDYYSASEFETSAIDKITAIHRNEDIVIATGGSMMYIDALCKGIDDVPTIDEILRRDLYESYEKDGLESIRAQLKILDPLFYKEVDLKNHKRVIHALEVCLMTGKPYSSFRKKTVKKRTFDIIKIGLMRDREDLYNRINKRVDLMVKDGLIEEAKKYYPMRNFNSLNTVGYKELFKYFDGEWNLDFAIEKIKQNTRIYSRKQMTWFKRDSDINWINLTEVNTVDAERIVKEQILGKN